MKELQKDLELISKWGLEERVKYYKNEITNMSVLVSQQRYGNYLYLNEKKELCYRNLIEQANGIFRKWNSFKLCFYNIRNLECKEVFANASIILNEIREMEEIFIYNCIKIRGE